MAGPQSLAQDWTELAEMDPTVNMMVQHNVPVTPQNYIDAYGAGGDGTEQEFPEEMPAALQGFEGVGLSELPQGPMPLPEGQMGGGPHTALGEVKLPPSNTLLSPSAQPPAIDRGEAARLTPLEPGGPTGQSRPIGQAVFKQQKPPQKQTPQQEED